jgi:hypothetical protein
MRVRVRRLDIWLGHRNEPGWCPVARAMNRATGRPWAVYGGCATELFKRPMRTHSLPASVLSFVVAFDAGKKVAPFAFDFEER